MTTRILLVEDNPITRKLVRFTLENQGFEVLEAPDAATALALFPTHEISLILQDLCLPDMDGFQLGARLRALPGAADIPILVFSGMLSHADEARVSASGFDFMISKPVEPSRLVKIVRSYLPGARDADEERMGAGRQLVVADDDPVQRKLVAFQMQRVGFEVRVAADGHEALDLARRLHPDAILSDVLMPGLDGFGLCIEVRKDPALARIPIVLTTNSYVEPKDRELARRAGAHDLVFRTPELREVLRALRESLAAEPTRREASATAVSAVETEHVGRMLRQLERQVALNAGISQRCALLSAEMAVLKGISEALANHQDIDDALRHTLAACFDAGGISLGALYLRDEDQLRVLSFGYSRDWEQEDLLTFFGAPDLLRDAFDAPGSTLILAEATSPEARRALATAGAVSALFVPICRNGQALGALVMLSRNGELQHDDRIKFAEAVAGQISQALAVAHAFRAKERSEQAAREQAAILRSVLDSIGDGVVVVDEGGSFILGNAAASEIGQFVKSVPPGSTFKSVSDSLEICGPDALTPMSYEQLPLTRALRGEGVDGAELFVRPEPAGDGVWLAVSGRPWRDEEGNARGGVAVFRDVTREKSVQAQLQISDRMASVGMLAAGVAHEINNPLACVMANLELCQRALDEHTTGETSLDTHELRESLKEAHEASERVRLIVRDLKLFARHEEANAGPVDIRKVVESSLRMAWNEIRHRAQLIKEYEDTPPVEGSESRLGQVFLNLIVNAAQAIPEGDANRNVIRVTTGHDAATDRVFFRITDTGTGIAPGDLNKLFRPFYTTKAVGAGTGLGLPISQRIVTSLGGEIQVESQLGKGTTFQVSLPPARTQAALAPVPAEPTPLPVRRARILVVDDEPKIAGLIRRMLMKEHDVVTTTAALEALQYIRDGQVFDVILCDLMMPQMTGMELYSELKKHDPAIAEKMVFLTGGAFTPSGRTFLDEVPNPRLDKPFRAQQLIDLVNIQLD